MKRDFNSGVDLGGPGGAMTVIWGNGVGDSTPEAEGGRGNGRACPSINGELGIWVKVSGNHNVV